MSDRLLPLTQDQTDATASDLQVLAHHPARRHRSFRVRAQCRFLWSHSILRYSLSHPFIVRSLIGTLHCCDCGRDIARCFMLARQRAPSSTRWPDTRQRAGGMIDAPAAGPMESAASFMMCWPAERRCRVRNTCAIFFPTIR